MADWLVYNQRVEAYGWSVSFWIFMELPLVGKIRRPMVWLAGGLATVIVASSAVGVGIWRLCIPHL